MICLDGGKRLHTSLPSPNAMVEEMRAHVVQTMLAVGAQGDLTF